MQSCSLWKHKTTVGEQESVSVVQKHLNASTFYNVFCNVAPIWSAVFGYTSQEIAAKKQIVTSFHRCRKVSHLNSCIGTAYQWAEAALAEQMWAAEGTDQVSWIQYFLSSTPPLMRGTFNLVSKLHTVFVLSLYGLSDMTIAGGLQNKEWFIARRCTWAACQHVEYFRWMFRCQEFIFEVLMADMVNT